jgi:hypothetical protein
MVLDSRRDRLIVLGGERVRAREHVDLSLAGAPRWARLEAGWRAPDFNQVSPRLTILRTTECSHS